MELPEQMARILQPHLVGSVSNDRAVLRDDKSGMTFQIAEMPKSARVIRIEKLQHLNGLADGGDLKRICDYLLVGARDDQDGVDVVLVEMKQSTSSRFELRVLGHPKKNTRTSRSRFYMGRAAATNGSLTDCGAQRCRGPSR